ncbi:MAG: AmmeMemoRadiSam system protein A [Caloramator sp.]|nr:AmmeMemoRadiSam system protein A [Caloramator sp.]
MPIIGQFLMPHPPIIISEVGRGEEKSAQKTIDACTKISKEVANLKPDTIIIITPHGPVFSDAVAICNASFIEGNLKNFNAPSVSFKFKINKELTDKIIDLADESEIPVAPLGENSYIEYNIRLSLDHGAIVPLYFINKEYKDFSLIHITYGMINPIKLYELGIKIAEVFKNSKEKAVIIASGDLSHKASTNSPYGFDELGPEFDNQLLDHLRDGKVAEIFTMDKSLVKRAAECGLRSLYILLGTLDEYDFKSEILSYEAPFGIGYANVKFIIEQNTESKLQTIRQSIENSLKQKRAIENPYVKLARESLEYYIKHQKYIKIPSYVTDEMLNQKSGVFVSIYKNGELRGCIGTIYPLTNSIAEEIIRNSVQSGTNDPRFYPVEEDELDELEYSVDVLMPPKPAAKEDLDPKRYGVIVRKGIRAGLLLPNLDGVDTVEKQLQIALKKAGISPNENYSIERFEVKRYR